MQIGEDQQPWYLKWIFLEILLLVLMGNDPTKMILSFLIGVGAFPGPCFVDEENRYITSVAQGRTQIRRS